MKFETQMIQLPPELEEQFPQEIRAFREFIFAQKK